MLARFFEITNVCFQIVLHPTPTNSIARPVEHIADYSSALAAFYDAFPRSR